MDLLDKLITYLAPRVALVAGQSIFYNELPETDNIPVKAMYAKEVILGEYVLPQIDAEVHIIKISARANNNTNAKALAALGYVSCYSETGIVELADDLIVAIELSGSPMWEKTDQQGRSYYYFTMKLISKRLL